MKKLLFVVIAIFIAITPRAEATIIDGSGNTFIDQATGYIWKDVNQFLDMTYNQVEAAISGTGFHLATESELKAMHASAGTNYQYLAPIMGDAPWSGQRILWGWFDGGYSSEHWYSWTWNNNPTWYYSRGESSVDNHRWSGNGAWVVNTGGNNEIPEPATMLLLGLGAGAIGLRRRKASA